MKKKISKKRKKKSDLKKEIKEIKSSDKVEEKPMDDEFEEFNESSPDILKGSFSSVLEKVEQAPQETNLEDVAEETGFSQTREEEKPVEYPVVGEDYESIIEHARKTNPNLVLHEGRRFDLETVGGLHPGIEQDFQINPELQELRRGAEDMEEDYIAREEKLEKDEDLLPFQKKAKEYRKFF